MLVFLENNYASIIIVILLAVCIFLAIRKIVKNKKSGKGTCSCECSNCSMNCENKKSD